MSFCLLNLTPWAFFITLIFSIGFFAFRNSLRGLEAVSLFFQSPVFLSASLTHVISSIKLFSFSTYLVYLGLFFGILLIFLNRTLFSFIEVSIPVVPSLIEFESLCLDSVQVSPGEILLMLSVKCLDNSFLVFLLLYFFCGFRWVEPI